MKVLTVDRLKAHYITHVYGVNRTVRAVDDVSFFVDENEIYGIAGESGCGKTTLIKVLTATHRPPLTVLGGDVIYDPEGRRIAPLTTPEHELVSFRWQYVSYIPQGSMNVLNPLQRIKVSFRQFIRTHRPQMGNAEIDAMVTDYLTDLGLPREVLHCYPHQLSGGMKQRVTISLATILTPRINIGDEPTTALDVVVQRGVIQLFKDIQSRQRSSFIVVTHDMGVHANLSDRMAIMYAGKIVEEAPTEVVFEAPRHPYTRFLIEMLPDIGEKRTIESIPGSPPPLDDPPPGCRFHPRCPIARPECMRVEPELRTIGDRHRVACHAVE
jgi:peptide/nickel transport system ATP-binding protein